MKSSMLIPIASRSKQNARVFHVARVPVVSKPKSLYRTPNSEARRVGQSPSSSPCQSQIARVEDTIACNFFAGVSLAIERFFRCVQKYYLF